MDVNRNPYDFSRTSIQSSCSEALDDDDPVAAYFKHRLAKSRQADHKKSIESAADSSLGVLDVDNISLLGDRISLQSQRLGSFAPSEHGELKNESRDSHICDDVIFKQPYSLQKEQVTKAEINLGKQRVLAQKALQRVMSKGDTHITKSTQSQLLSNANEKTASLFTRDWLECNQTPGTPRYFKDELNSITSEELSVAFNGERKVPSKSPSKSFQVLAEKKCTNMNSVEKIGAAVNINDSFKIQNTDDAIKRFEEDERKFVAEQLALSHNSQISQFSGIGSGEIIAWPSMPCDLDNSNGKKLSIGQFFGMRSNSISSIVGRRDQKDYSVNTTNFEQNLPSSTITGSLVAEQSPFSDLKGKRCLSSCDFKKTPDLNSIRRHSNNDSCGSSSTTAIQDLLAGMESGLSGTQVCERLMDLNAKKPTRREEKTRRSETKGLVSVETPKSSKPTSTWSNQKESANKVKPDADRLLNNFKNLSVSRKSTPISNRHIMRHDRHSSEFKENSPIGDLRPSKLENQGVLCLKNEKTKKVTYDTPLPADERRMKKKSHLVGNKLEMDEPGWEPLKTSCIQPTINLNKTVHSVMDFDKTLQNTSSISCESRKVQGKSFLGGTITIEDTITAGDLTILSQRIDQLKEESVCIVRAPEIQEPALLKVVQVVAGLPKGTVDCSALTPLLRDQFPELLSTLENSDAANMGSDIDGLQFSRQSLTHDSMTSEPGSWIKLCSRRGFRDRIHACAEVKKDVFIPLVNLTNQWLLVSISSISLQHENGKLLEGTILNDEWAVDPFLNVVLKETLVPPDAPKELKISIVCRIPTILNIKIKLRLQDLFSRDTQFRKLQIRVIAIDPTCALGFLPTGEVNFGVIPEQCIAERPFKLIFGGICDLPLRITIQETGSHSQQFSFASSVVLNGNPLGNDIWHNDECFVTLKEGREHSLEFQILFQPKAVLTMKDKTQINMKALITVMVDVHNEVENILWRIPVSGSVAYSKFLCNPSCSPLIFRTSTAGQSVTRSFPFKNVGAIPIELSVQVVCDETKEEQTDGLFTAPKSVYLPKNEETHMRITFSGNTRENCTKRLLTLRLKPNGQVLYDTELIGIVVNAPDDRPSSPCSTRSGSTVTSASTSDLVPIKLMTSCHSLSWPAVALEKEMKMTFQIRNASNIRATARLTFKKNTSAFNFINDQGEKIQKLRKILKPNIPISLTVVFKPDTVGLLTNEIYMETNSASKKNMIPLSGVGGFPNIFLRNTTSDLNGRRMIKLLSTETESNDFTNKLELFNKGNLAGFVYVKPISKELLLTSEVVVRPTKLVVQPNTRAFITISQKLKNEDIKTVLTGKEIGQIAELSIVMGDEACRHRIRRLVQKETIAPSGITRNLACKFVNEPELDIKRLDDDKSLEKAFLKTLRTFDVAVVVERVSSLGDPTILEDVDETMENFVTAIECHGKTLSPPYSTPKCRRNSPALENSYKNDSRASGSSGGSTVKRTRNIANWLRAIDDPVTPKFS